MNLKLELEAIAFRAGGLLKPIDVVQAAAAEDHPLHECFNWNDSSAANEHRLDQARTLIRSVRVDVPKALGVTVQAFVSLAGDRRAPGGGYRSIEEVMDNQFYARQLVAEMEARVKYWRKEMAAFGMMVDFEPIDRAVEEIARKVAPGAGKAAA